MQTQVQLEALRSMFRAALAAKGMERLEHFTWLCNHCDAMARTHIHTEACPERFAFAYANLQHNYGNALMLGKGMQMRLMTRNFRRAGGQPDYTPAECRTHLKRFDEVLVSNGGDTIELITQAIEHAASSRRLQICA